MDCIVELNKQFEEKEHRFNYTAFVNNFVFSMINISLVLKGVEMGERKSKLLTYIKQGNKAIRRNRMVHKELSYFWGITIPFERSHEKEHASNLVRVGGW